MENFSCCQEKASLPGGFFQSFPVLLLFMSLFFPLQQTQIILIDQGFFFLFSCWIMYLSWITTRNSLVNI